jgi:hypothetical protein
MTWKRLDVSPDAAEKLKTAFMETFERASHPRNAAVFEVPAGTAVQLYFSPGATTLFEVMLKTVSTKNAGAPPPGAKLVVGDPGTWARG